MMSLEAHSISAAGAATSGSASSGHRRSLTAGWAGGLSYNYGYDSADGRYAVISEMANSNDAE
jgi:hypothetical protein